MASPFENILTGSILVGLAVFFIVLLIYASLSSKGGASKRIGKKASVYENWGESVYALFFSAMPESALPFFLINKESFLTKCEIANVSNGRYEDSGNDREIGERMLREIVVHRFIAYLLLVLACVLSVIGGLVYLAIGVLVAIPFFLSHEEAINRKVNTRRSRMSDELARFMDLFQTALYIQLPVEEAIVMTCKHLPDTVVAEEFARAIADVKIGAYSFSESLERLSRKYEVENLSDFVMEIVNGYEKGISIYEIVNEKSHDIKQMYVLSLKERATKLASVMYIPIALFKILPLLLMLCLPILIQLQNF